MRNGASEPLPSLCRESSPPKKFFTTAARGAGWRFFVCSWRFCVCVWPPKPPRLGGRRLRRGQRGSQRNKNSARGHNGTVCCLRASGGRNFRASARRNFRVSGGRNLEAPSFADHPTPSDPFLLDPQYAPFSPPPALASLALSIKHGFFAYVCFYKSDPF